MTIRLKLVVTILLLTCFLIPIAILSWEGLENRYKIAIQVASAELSLVAIFYLVSFFYTRHASIADRDQNESTEFPAHDFGKLIGISLVFLSIFFLLATAVLLEKHNRYLDSQLEFQFKQQALIRKQTEFGITAAKQAKRRQLLDTLYQERDPKDQSIPELYGTSFGKHSPRLPKADLRSRQEAVLEFIKLERDLGKEIDLSRAFLNNLDLGKYRLKRHHLEGALQGANFEAARLAGTNFKETNLRGAIFRGSNLESARFSSSDLTGADLRASNLEGVIFSETRLAGARLYGSYIKLTIFFDSFLDGAIVRSPKWIENYMKISPKFTIFRLDHYKLVKQQDESGNTIYVFDGQDPVLLAKKP
ncbi:pentapeptide repeat-containing protein [Gimesia chilikensis]|uniref:pentapeptide repeat-containing protein n=1 Tax=Gimesia chilikensis TaxID=2605989 RepID=UPI0011ED3914|nr:pentapeptide repeat-containing protein [Gimesia chilikensis]KAA0139803.1 pentapeptide repeat-containing protein [Gimesia chilikensis]